MLKGFSPLLPSLSLIVLCILSATPASAQVCAAYVGNEGSGTVSVIDTAKALVDPTNAVTATITVGTHPDVGAITPDGAFAYVANGASCDVSVIGTATNTVKSTIAVGCGATDVAITPDGTFAYVTNNASSSVSVIDTAKALTDPTNSVITTISSLAGGVEDIAISPDGAFAYVTTGTNVSVISTATNTVTTTIPIPSANPFGSHNVGVAFTPDGAFAYIASRHNNNVAVIDTAKSLTDPATALVSTIPVGSGPNGLAITSNGAFVYVANVNSNTVSVINTATNTVIATVPVGQTPVGVAITPDSGFAYVTNNASSSVSVIDTTKALTDPASAVLATVPVGSSPYHLAISCLQLSFPLRATCDGFPCTAFTAMISSVMDHSGTPLDPNNAGAWYSEDGKVRAYTGETGEAGFGVNCSPGPGYKNTDGKDFIVNGNYVGAKCSDKPKD